MLIYMDYVFFRVSLKLNEDGKVEIFYLKDVVAGA